MGEEFECQERSSRGRDAGGGFAPQRMGGTPSSTVIFGGRSPTARTDFGRAGTRNAASARTPDTPARSSSSRRRRHAYPGRPRGRGAFSTRHSTRGVDHNGASAPDARGRRPPRRFPGGGARAAKTESRQYAQRPGRLAAAPVFGSNGFYGVTDAGGRTSGRRR